jgi:transposase
VTSTSDSKDTPLQGDPASPKKPRPTYPQKWSAYNAAQTHEKECVADLLHSMCDAIPSLEQSRGRPRIPLGETVFAAVWKVYGTASGRRTASNLRECEAKGHLARAPHHSSVFRALKNPKLTPILKSLIEETAAPLRGIETDFAVDSTGFSTSTYERWFSHKYGRQVQKQNWIKAHAMIGVRTNVVTSIEVTTIHGADCPQLPQLLEASRKRFNVRTVAADKAYISHKNLTVIDEAGAYPLIPFKDGQNRKGAYWRKDGTGKNPKEARDLWNRFYDYYHGSQAEFYKHYHQRSNVETTFSMIKAKLGPYVRSRTLTAQVNEVLAKVLCHNLCCLVHASYESMVA